MGDHRPTPTPSSISPKSSKNKLTKRAPPSQHNSLPTTASLVPGMKRALDDGKVEEDVVPAVADPVQKVEEVVVSAVADPPQERRQFIIDVFFDEDEWPPRNGLEFDAEDGYEEEEVNTLDLKFLYT